MIKITRYKFRHFYLNKYLVSLFKSKKYHLSYEYNHKVLWFRTYKVASRTIDKKLRDHSKPNSYIYASQMSYLPWMFKKYFKFAFVRNPEQRFISAWKDKVLKQNYFHFPESEYERMKELDYFLSWVERLDITKCDEHLRSQTSLIDLNNIDFIGRLENFENDFKVISQYLGEEDFKMEFLNQSKKQEVQLTDEQKRRIHQLYRKDFQIFYPNEA